MQTSEFNRLMKYAHMNDDPDGILNRIYDTFDPHPYFDPKKIAFSMLYDFDQKQYTTPIRDNRIIVWDMCEGFDSDIVLKQDIRTEDILIKVCTGPHDNLYKCRTAFYSYDWVGVQKVNREIQLNYQNTRKYFADILIGKNPIPGRTIFYNLLVDNDLIKNNIVSYQDYYVSSFLKDSTDPKEKLFQKSRTSMEFFNGEWLSYYIQPFIYENSWISVIYESRDSGVFFPTEKIGKPLRGGRIFLGVFPAHFLQGLRDLGLKTFSNIIDESYDQIEDLETRIAFVVEELKRLSKLDPVYLYNQVQQEIEHNKKCMMDREWLTRDIRMILDPLATPV